VDGGAHRWKRISQVAVNPNIFPILMILRFTTEHKFQKPNDERGIRLMNRCAEEILKVSVKILLIVT
jgi:tRNA(His) 5'-end guanylyltransferase